MYLLVCMYIYIYIYSYIYIYIRESVITAYHPPNETELGCSGACVDWVSEGLLCQWTRYRRLRQLSITEPLPKPLYSHPTWLWVEKDCDTDDDHTCPVFTSHIHLASQESHEKSSSFPADTAFFDSLHHDRRYPPHARPHLHQGRQFGVQRRLHLYQLPDQRHILAGPGMRRVGWLVADRFHASLGAHVKGRLKIRRKSMSEKIRENWLKFSMFKWNSLELQQYSHRCDPQITMRWNKTHKQPWWEHDEKVKY